MTPEEALSDAETQRVLIGILTERLGGKVFLPVEEMNNSLSASGHGDLHVLIAPEGITFEVLPKEGIRQ